MSRFARLTTALAAALTIGSLSLAPAFAWPAAMEGRPEQLEAGGDLGYYIWHDEAGLHLRTTGPAGKHVFHASLHSLGEFRDVRLIRIEGADSFAIRDGGHVLETRFETWEGIDGVDFRLEGGRGMHVALSIDGALARTDEIFVGSGGVHPNHTPDFVTR